MEKTDKNKVIEEIKNLHKIYMQCRSVFPALTDEVIGKTAYSTAPFYEKRGFSFTMVTEKPITREFVIRNRILVKWTNENVIIRLYGIMHYYGLYNKIDYGCSGADDVDLVRRMRNAFSKTGLNYRPEDPKNLRLRDRVIEDCNLDRNLYKEGEIPTPIDTVIEKLFKSCLNYIEEKMA